VSPSADGGASAARLAARLGLRREASDRLVARGRGVDVELRLLHAVQDMAPLESLQREVMGATDLDVYGRASLVVVPDSGGHVIAAFVRPTDRPDAGRELAGALIGFGGWRPPAGGRPGAPRIVSDWMGVRPAFRSAGLGALLKRTQAVVALEAGFEEVVWTVDPLRAANARLNHGVLGAVGEGYEIDRYGTTYATGLYGGLPSDRLVVRWDLVDPAVQDHVVAPPPPVTVDDLRSLDDRRAVDGDELPLSGFVEIPPDVDALVAADGVAARQQRERVRGELLRAFDAGAVVRGFAAAGRAGRPALVLGRSDGAGPGRRRDDDPGTSR
jgi:predicted GNAT superfamily acetyltransferase